jgi:hypothetical protein
VKKQHFIIVPYKRLLGLEKRGKERAVLGVSFVKI